MRRFAPEDSETLRAEFCGPGGDDVVWEVLVEEVSGVFGIDGYDAGLKERSVSERAFGEHTPEVLSRRENEGKTDLEICFHGRYHIVSCTLWGVLEALWNNE